jgi:putative flippase GtrA
MEKIKKLWKFFTSPEMLSYLFFGVCTTVINIVVFWLMADVFQCAWEPSNLLAWILSVAFAFITNKLFVFKSRGATPKKLLWEILTFVGARLLSLGVDMGTMWLLLEVLHTSNLTAKIISNILVIIINYVLSKLVIFKKK